MMGLLSGAMKAGVAAKVMQVVRREAAKPENQRKAKELLSKLANKSGSKSGSARRRGH